MSKWCISFKSDAFTPQPTGVPVEVWFQVYVDAGTMGAAILRAENAVEMMKVPSLATAYRAEILGPGTASEEDDEGVVITKIKGH